MQTRAELLLRWYDAHARTLPWRETTPDPYRVWLSEIMLQQTTTTAVAPFYRRFLDRWPTVFALADAADADVMSAWAGLGYYARARNLLACARMVRDVHGGRFPDNEAGLRALPGIGPYTGAAIAAIAFDRHAVVVDGNIERVVSRLFAIETPLPASRPAIRVQAETLTPAARPGDFAQAMMDLGATICTPTRPACILCPLQEGCLARQQGLQNTLPLRSPKAMRPTKGGVAFVAVRTDGAVLVQTRAGQGLLGGMTEFPGAWPLETDAKPAPAEVAPLAAQWRDAGRATHGFTHFDLELRVFRAEIDSWHSASAPARWVARDALGREAFPTLMRKVAAAADFPLPEVAVSDSDGHGPERARSRSKARSEQLQRPQQTVQR